MFSVIVPSYNSKKTIGVCLKSLLKQSLPKKHYEVIVVDDGSTDGTVELVSEFPVKLFKQPHRGPAAARNFGAKHSKGNILFFTDADCVPDRNWIKTMVEPFEDEQVAGVSGAYKTLNKDKLIARFAGYEIEERHEKLKKQKYIDFIGTFSAAYRKNVFFKFGGFDTKFAMASAEDSDLSFNVSKSKNILVFQPKAFVYHTHPDTLWKFLKQKFWRGYWRIPLYKKHKEKIFRHSYTPKTLFLETALTGLTFLSLIFALLKIMPMQISLFLLLLTVLLSLPFSIRIYKKDKEVGLLSPIIIILRNLSTGIGIICGIIFSRR